MCVNDMHCSSMESYECFYFVRFLCSSGENKSDDKQPDKKASKR